MHPCMVTIQRSSSHGVRSTYRVEVKHAIIYTTLTKANVKLYVTLPTINPANFNWAEPHLPVIPITNCYSAYYVKLGKTSHQAVQLQAYYVKLRKTSHQAVQLHGPET